MPIITVAKQKVSSQLYDNKDFTKEQFEDILFLFGLELDDVLENGDFRVEIHANRPDLLSERILLHCLALFKGLPSTIPLITPTKTTPSLINNMNVSSRPHIAMAILKGVSLSPQKLAQLLEFQEKLCLSLGKARELVAIGIHDNSTVTLPITYKEINSKEVKFKALFETEEMSVAELFKKYTDSGSTYKKYVALVDETKVPCFLDNNNQVLSLPPVINSAKTACTASTTEILLDITGTDKLKVDRSLILLLTALSGYYKELELITPLDLKNDKLKVTTNYAETNIGIQLLEYKHMDEVLSKIKDTELLKSINLNTKETLNEINREAKDNLKRIVLKHLLSKMGFISNEQGNVLEVSIPLHRIDIMHEFDLLEEIAVAFGVNDIPRQMPKVCTFGVQNDKQKLKEQLRIICSSTGFIEANSFALGSSNINKQFLKEGEELVSVSNYKSSNFDSLRPSLIPGLVCTGLSNLKELGMPIHLFEVGDVCTNKGQKMKLAATILTNKGNGIELVHGLLDKLGKLFGIEYELTESSLNLFVEKRGIDIDFNNSKKKDGVMGILNKDYMTLLGVTNYNVVINVVEIRVKNFLK
eukprot:GAHX01000911.1.p1 GENE.GAHX01000911.1~~GAHX01000911.1.p1  ORF type:complete len:587 (-),score=145.07 GAHX01000911.1:39-1799(-)